jgi:hypothetical protein
MSGAAYRVQYKTNASDTQWLDLLPDVLATGATASRTNQPIGRQRFYRIRLL